MRATILTVAALAASTAAAADDPLKLADEAYGHGNYQQAREFAKQALAREPARAWRVVGTSSCLLKDRPAALDAIAHLRDKGDVELIRFACQRAEVDITDEDAQIAASPARDPVTRAQAAYSANKYLDAKKLAQQAVVLDGKLAPAWRILGAAACWTKDRKEAERASEHLQPVDQEVVRSTCARTLGVQLKNPRVLR